MHGAALARAQAPFGLRARSPEAMHGAALARAQSPFGLRARSPKLCMVQPLPGLRRLLASVRIWPDERYRVGGNDSITTVCQVQAGNGPLPEGEGLEMRAVIVAFRLQSASEEGAD